MLDFSSCYVTYVICLVLGFRLQIPEGVKRVKSCFFRRTFFSVDSFIGISKGLGTENARKILASMFCFTNHELFQPKVSGNARIFFFVAGIFEDLEPPSNDSRRLACQIDRTL